MNFLSTSKLKMWRKKNSTGPKLFICTLSRRSWETGAVLIGYLNANTMFNGKDGRYGRRYGRVRQSIRAGHHRQGPFRAVLVRVTDYSPWPLAPEIYWKNHFFSSFSFLRGVLTGFLILILIFIWFFLRPSWRNERKNGSWKPVVAC